MIICSSFQPTRCLQRVAQSLDQKDGVTRKPVADFPYNWLLGFCLPRLEIFVPSRHFTHHLCDRWLFLCCVSFLTVSIQTMKAARTNPEDTVQYE
jgi:hypothetical protein